MLPIYSHGNVSHLHQRGIGRCLNLSWQRSRENFLEKMTVIAYRLSHENHLIVIIILMKINENEHEIIYFLAKYVLLTFCDSVVCLYDPTQHRKFAVCSV